MKIKHTKIFIIFIIFILPIFIYINTTQNGFVLDDEYVILQNPVIRSVDLEKIFTSNYVPIYDPTYAPGYRPITTLTFSINYLFGELRPTGYHLVNIIIHAINSILAFLIALKLFKEKLFPAFGVALIFALHPVQTDVVAAVVGRADMLAFAFLFIGFFIHIKYEDYRNRFSMLFYFLALLCKESVILFPGVIVFYDFTFRQRKFNLLLRQNGLYYMEFALVALLYTTIRMGAVGLVPAKINFLDNPVGTESFGVRLLNFPILYYNYLKLLFFPVNLSPDYSYNQIPVIKTFFNFKLICSWFIVLTTLFIWIKSKKTHPLFFFGLSFFLISLFLYLQILFPIGSTIAERFLYLPIFGWALMFIYLFHFWINITLKPKIPIIILILIMIGLGVRTYHRNQDWANNESLYVSSLRKAPNNSKLMYNIGVISAENNQFEKAKSFYREALEINPFYENAYNNLGAVYLRTAEYDSAIIYFRKAINISNFPKPVYYDNLAFAYTQKKEYKNAAEAYKYLIRANHKVADNYFNLGLTYYFRRKYKKAIEVWSKILEIEPGYIQAKEYILKAQDKLKMY